MPKVVDQLTEAEKQTEARIREHFTQEQMCADFLTKMVRSLYQFDDDFITGWYEEMFGKRPDPVSGVCCELVQAYTRILMVEHNYRYILDYWIRQYQEKFLNEMRTYFEGKPAN